MRIVKHFLLPENITSCKMRPLRSGFSYDFWEIRKNPEKWWIILKRRIIFNLELDLPSRSKHRFQWASLSCWTSCSICCGAPSLICKAGMRMIPSLALFSVSVCLSEGSKLCLAVQAFTDNPVGNQSETPGCHPREIITLPSLVMLSLHSAEYMRTPRPSGYAGLANYHALNKTQVLITGMYS